jgi:hypothetical protein
MAVAHDLVAAPARGAILFEHSHVISVFGETGGGGNPANASANHDSGWFLGHVFPSF